jgi:Fe-S-cluster-containing hydrogenase component 2
MARTRKIVRIDEDLCNGCGQCVTACAEAALEVVEGKARLIGEIYCDGLGACLGECPQGALSIEERPAEEFDERAVESHLSGPSHPESGQPGCPGAACPGAALRTLRKEMHPPTVGANDAPSRLGHWPVQLRLVPPDAPFLAGADLLVCADCVPFAMAGFHEAYLAGRAVLVGCPKLDDIAYYRSKLRDLFAEARPSRVTVLRMEVPCCGAIAQAVLDARNSVCPDMPLEIHTVGIRGRTTREIVEPIQAGCHEVNP